MVDSRAKNMFPSFMGALISQSDQTIPDDTTTPPGDGETQTTPPGDGETQTTPPGDGGGK